MTLKSSWDSVLRYLNSTELGSRDFSSHPTLPKHTAQSHLPCHRFREVVKRDRSVRRNPAIVKVIESRGRGGSFVSRMGGGFNFQNMLIHASSH